MRLKIISFISIICLSQSTFAQQSEPFYSTKKEQFAWFFNPGFSFGFGGYRAFNAVPMISLKLGPINLSGMYIPGQRTKLWSYGVGLDIYQFTDAKGRSNAFGITGGYNGLHREPEFYKSYRSHNLLLTYAKYRPGSRAKWSVYGGLSWLQEYNSLVEQYENQKFIPWVGLSLDLYAMRLPKYREVSDRDSISIVPRIYQSNAFFAKNFNPSVGLGIGTGFGGSMGYSFQMNVSSAYVRVGRSFNVNPDPIGSATSVQVGLNFYRFRLHRSFATYGTISSDFTVQRYNCGTMESPDWCLDMYSRGSVLTGLNGYFYDRRFSFTAKAGVGWRDGNSFVQDFESNKAVYPVGEIGFQVHFFKFRRIAYEGNLQWDNEEGVVQPERIKTPRDSLKPGDIFNVLVSVGAGVDHPLFLVPTVGIQIFRIYLTTGYFKYNNRSSLSISGDIEAGFFNERTSLLIGGSYINWNGDRNLSSLNLGTNYIFRQRSRINAKVGLGLYSIGITEKWIPVAALSYQFYLLQF